MKTCVIIPTYNESKTIGELSILVRKEGFDVIVVDDGSKDNTATIAEENGASVITHKENRGKGASLKAGFAYAVKNYYDGVIVMDGDGQHNPKDIKRFIQAAESTHADLIVGNRMGDTKNMPFLRWVTNRWMSNFISRACKQYIPDTQCGFRFIKSGLLKEIRLTSSKYETESEILIRAGRGKFKIDSIPIESVYKGEVSSIHPIIDAFRFIRLILNMAFEKK